MRPPSAASARSARQQAQALTGRRQAGVPGPARAGGAGRAARLRPDRDGAAGRPGLLLLRQQRAARRAGPAGRATTATSWSTARPGWSTSRAGRCCTLDYLFIVSDCTRARRAHRRPHLRAGGGDGLPGQVARADRQPRAGRRAAGRRATPKSRRRDCRCWPPSRWTQHVAAMDAGGMRRRQRSRTTRPARARRRTAALGADVRRKRGRTLMSHQLPQRNRRSRDGLARSGHQ